MFKALLKFSPIFKYVISGNSMSPTLKPGQIILVNRFYYLMKNPKVEDLIALKDPRDGKILIKRIAKIDNNNFFVTGDNEKASTDSRSFGWIRKRDILGKVIF